MEKEWPLLKPELEDKSTSEMRKLLNYIMLKLQHTSYHQTLD